MSPDRQQVVDEQSVELDGTSYRKSANKARKNECSDSFEKDY